MGNIGVIVQDQPSPISAAKRRTRLRRIKRIAGELGFVGNVEYRHVYSQTGGAQYCIGESSEDHIMVVYAEAFERDANPEQFNLDALIAHECGHQRLHRDAKVRPFLTKFPGDPLEEVLASLVGSVLLDGSESSRMLMYKAFMELSELGLPAERAEEFLERLANLLRATL